MCDIPCTPKAIENNVKSATLIGGESRDNCLKCIIENPMTKNNKIPLNICAKKEGYNIDIYVEIYMLNNYKYVSLLDNRVLVSPINRAIIVTRKQTLC